MILNHRTVYGRTAEEFDTAIQDFLNLHPMDRFRLSITYQMTDTCIYAHISFHEMPQASPVARAIPIIGGDPRIPRAS